MDLLTTILIAVIFFFMGAAIIGIIWYFQGVSRRASSMDKAANPPDPNLDEVARLMRDTQTQDLVVGMDGKTFRAAHELSQAQQRRLNFTSNVLTKWLAAQPAPAFEPALEGQPAAPTPEAAPQENEWVPAENIPAEAQHIFVPAFTTEPLEEVKPVSMNLPDVVGGIIGPAPKPVPEFKSIATQINDILQAKLVGTPLDARGITVNDAPDHGVMVTLDGQKYPGVKDVPDEEVRNLIRSAVLEWEKLSKAGVK